MPPIAKTANPIKPSMPKIGADRLVIAAGAPVVNEDRIITYEMENDILILNQKHKFIKVY